MPRVMRREYWRFASACVSRSTKYPRDCRLDRASGVPDGKDQWIEEGGRRRDKQPPAIGKFCKRASDLKNRSRSDVLQRARESADDQNSPRNTQNNPAARAIETGKVRIQASARLRTVRHCSPEPFAAMVPATPEDSTWVVLTGKP